MTEPRDLEEIELPAGKVRYREAGSGRPVVFAHGYLVDGRLWDGVVDRLADRFRCIAPDWPMGAHRVPMAPDADLTPTGMAALIASFLEKLDLDDVTIVGNDSGGAISQVLVTRHPERIGRLVLTNCDTHANFPPGPFKALPPIANLPGVFDLVAMPFRVPAIGRAAFRPFAKSRIPPQLVASWFEPGQRDRDIRRDLKKVTAGFHKRYTIEAAEKLGASGVPLLLAWAPEDRVFPLKYAERLADDARGATIVQIPNARTFVPIDQPARLADEIAAFATAA